MTEDQAKPEPPIDWKSVRTTSADQARRFFGVAPDRECNEVPGTAKPNGTSVYKVRYGSRKQG